jgi:hypothetical protein
MPGNNTERIKIYVVIGLSLVFGIVGYFRFFYKKAEADVKPIEQAEVPSKIDLSSVQPIIQGRKQLSKELSTEFFQPIARDIFAPLTTPKRANVSKMQGMNKEKQKPLPALRLKGTIVGGERPIAIVNDMFLRTGDEIAGFKVVWIGTNAVVMEAGDRKLALEMLKVE